MGGFKGLKDGTQWAAAKQRIGPALESRPQRTHDWCCNSPAVMLFADATLSDTAWQAADIRVSE
jgi:hypothetical protein